MTCIEFQRGDDQLFGHLINLTVLRDTIDENEDEDALMVRDLSVDGGCFNVALNTSSEGDGVTVIHEVVAFIQDVSGENMEQRRSNDVRVDEWGCIIVRVD